MGETVAEIKKRLKPKRLKGLASPSTVLNLANTGQYDVGYLLGHYYLFVGDSNSGKTYLALATLAEASINPVFDDYRLIMDNGENGALMDIRKHFGSKLANRLEPPRKDKNGDPVHSRLLEDFFFNVEDALAAGPCIYLLDSVDALTTKSSDKKFIKEKAAYLKRVDGGKGKEEAGSYGDGKAKEISDKLRRLMGPNGPLSSTKSIVIIINQSRDNIGRDAIFNPKTRSGGNALVFYATSSIWYSIKKKVKIDTFEHKSQNGLISKVHVKRSRITGKDRIIEIPIMQGVGVDDLGSCVDYLLDWKYWKKKAGRIQASEFDVVLGREELIHHIEETNSEDQLRQLVQKRWDEVEALCNVQRKPRYV